MSRRRDKRDKNQFFHSRHFREGTDSYVAEYEAWTHCEIFKSVAGVFEIPRETFLAKTQEEILSVLGFGNYRVINYNADDGKDDYYAPDGQSHVAGYSFAAWTPHTKVNSFVFMREDVGRDETIDPSLVPERDAIAKLCILMHEMGHAEDIELSINYDHQKPSFNEVEGEEYAHRFALRHMKRLGYPAALKTYCRMLENDLRSSNSVYREAAGRVWENLTITRGI